MVAFEQMCACVSVLHDIPYPELYKSELLINILYAMHVRCAWFIVAAVVVAAPGVGLIFLCNLICLRYSILAHFAMSSSSCLIMSQLLCIDDNYRYVPLLLQLLWNSDEGVQRDYSLPWTIYFLRGVHHFLVLRVSVPSSGCAHELQLFLPTARDISTRAYRHSLRCLVASDMFRRG